MYNTTCECVCVYLAVAVAGQLRDEAHMILSDLNHLLTDIVLRAAAYGRA